MNPLTRHPNAIIGGLGGGAGLGYAVLQLLADYGVHLSSKQSGLVAAGCAIGTLLLAGPAKYVWANGVKSVWRRIVDGKPGATTAAREPSAGTPGAVSLHLHGDASQLIAALDAVRATYAAQIAPVEPEPVP